MDNPEPGSSDHYSVSGAARQGASTLASLPVEADRLPAFRGAGIACIHGAFDFHQVDSQRLDRVAPDYVLQGLTDADQWFGDYLHAGAPLPEAAVSHCMRILAASVLLRGLEAADAGVRLRDHAPPMPNLERRLRDAERAIRLSWQSCRQLARRVSLTDLAGWYSKLQDYLEALWPLTASACAAHTQLQKTRVPSVRVAELVREAGLMAAAAPLLAYRFHDDRLRTTTDDIARRRTRLLRRDGPGAFGGMPRIPPGAKTATLIGLLTQAQWFELPQKPYALAQTASGAVLRLPYKRFQSRGIMAGMAFWAAGRVKPEAMNGQPVLEIEAEGPGQHASDVFRDWIATEARQAYDRHPGSLRLAAELPNTVHGGVLQMLRTSLPIPRAREEGD